MGQATSFPGESTEERERESRGGAGRARKGAKGSMAAERGLGNRLQAQGAPLGEPGL